jgi:hypothetical protein
MCALALNHLRTQAANPSRLVPFEKLIVPQLTSRGNLVANWTVRGSNPGREKSFIFSETSRPPLETTQSLSQWAPSSLVGVKQPGFEIYPLSPIWFGG